MLELINKTSQTVSAAGVISLGSTTITDGANRMYATDGNTIVFPYPGKYRISALFNVENTASAVSNVTIELYANGSAIGIPITVTVPETTGYSEIVIDKTVNIRAAATTSTASVQFITSTGATVTGSLVDVYKRS